MKKMFKLFLAFVAIASMATLVSCEGPAGAAGMDGIDGTNGTDGADGEDGDVSVTCLACHSENTIVGINAQFVQSQHKLGEFVDYAGGRGACAQCHSSDGFIEYATFGSVEGTTINAPGAWECATCHGLHKTFEADDYALRMTDPVKFAYDNTTVADLGGNSNLCGNCHQTRTAEPNIAAPGATFTITNTHYGPHHGPQANLLFGVGFAEIAGTEAYPTTKPTHLNLSCVGCHMAEYADGQGGHTWNPTVGACTSCHAGTEDFDVAGFQTEIEEMLVTLRDQLIVLGVVAGNDVDGYHPVTGTYPMVQAQAFFNWVGIEEDRSLGVHNPKYIEALLINSIEATAPEL